VSFRALCIAFAWPVLAAAQVPAQEERSAIPPGALDPRLPPKPLGPALLEVAQQREAAPALEHYAAGDYAGAAALGEEVLVRTPDSHALRLAVADSYAWTGRYDPALRHYKMLLGTSYESRARVGMAEVLRWQGRADTAEAQYLAALASEPQSDEARKGLALARRELRPALTLRFAETADNQHMRRHELAAVYRRWSDDRAWRFEVGALAERNRGPTQAWSAGMVSAALWGTRLPLHPRLDLSVYDSGLRPARLFGGIELEPLPERLKLRLARVDWARLAFTEGAAVDGLTASSAGLQADAQFAGGTLRGRLDAYDISDGNRVADGELQATPAWQPLPARLVWFGGLYGRNEEREDPRYWSPRPLYGLALLGLQRSWSLEHTDVSASARRGFPVTGSARTSWSAGINARHWLRGDVAVGLDAWVAQVPRPEEYRMRQVAAFVQHVW
jgi:tetratricopeptide (TPR) repeat protein